MANDGFCMLGLSSGTWSVAVTVRAPEYQVNQFLEHYVGLGADKIYLFFDDAEFASYDRVKYSGKVVAQVCDNLYWDTVRKIAPLHSKVGRPEAVETRQGSNALVARDMMTSAWLLHVDIDEFIYVKKDVKEVLSEFPCNVFSVLLRSLEAVYDRVNPEGCETDTVYFKKSVQQKDLLRQLYSEEMLKCAINGFWGTPIGKSFVRKEPAIRTMSVHWPTPVDVSLLTNVPTYFIDLLHFEGQTYELFKEKFKIRVFKNVAKHMPATYHVRLDITKKAYEAYGDEGLLRVYKDFYVMDPEKLQLAMTLGVVVKVDWVLGGVSKKSRLINNPIFDLGARPSNWGGTVLKTYHNTYVAYDTLDSKVKAFTAAELVNRKTAHPVEVEIIDGLARLFVRLGHEILGLKVDGENLIAAAEMSFCTSFKVSQRNTSTVLSYSDNYLSARASREMLVNREVASHWEFFSLKTIYPQLS